MSVTAPTATVTVTTVGGAVLVRPPTTASSQTFAVAQTAGTVPATYNLAAACTAPAATTCPVSLSPITFTANNTPQNVVVNFTSGVAGAATGRVTLTATHSTLPATQSSSFADVRVVNATVAPLTVSTTVPGNSTGQSLSYTVTNTGPVAATFDLTGVCAGTASLTACQASPTQLVNLAINVPTTVTVTYNTGATAASGTVALQARYQAVLIATGTTNVSVTAAPATVTVTPVGGALLVRPPTTASSQTFAVTQTAGPVPATYNLAAACTAPAATTCPVSLSPITLTANNTPENVVVNFTSGSAGAATGRVTLTATHSTIPAATNNGFVDVRVVNATAVPTLTSTTVLGSQTSLSLTYTVTNTGPVAATFDLTGVCAGTPALSACQASPVQLPNLAVQTPTSVTVTYNTGAPPATGTVSLQVNFAGVVVATGSTTVTVASSIQQAPTVSVTRWNPGATVPREECVTISLGSAAAAECGSLRLVHQVPGLRTLNKDRAPTLLYSSEQAEPTPQVAVMVSVPVGVIRPDTIRAVLKLAGVVRGQAPWVGTQWTVGAPRLIRVRDTVAAPPTTGISSYTVDMTSIYNSPAAQLTSTVSQAVAVVNRQASPFGRGWWLGGLEQFNPTTFVWVGGDGSVRQYQSAGTDKWVALPAVDYPDTLKRTSTTPVEYTRFLRGGLKVVFDAQGRHVRTVNRVGHTTRFWYNASGRLDSIALPVRGAAPADGRTFVFTFPTNQVLIGDGQGRTTTMTLAGGTVNRVTSIGGPDAFSVTFGYPAAASGLITTRTDRVGAVRRFTFDSLRHATRSALFPGPPYTDADSIIATLQPAESRGAPFGTSIDTASVTTAYDGPRPAADVADLTTFWTNAFGAPWKILDAANGTTLLERTSTAYAGFVTRVTTPAGRVLVATPDPRGRVRTVIDQTVTSSPTTYSWEDGFDQLTRIDPPEADFTVFDVQPSTGNRIGQSDGRGLSSNIAFGYNAGQLVDVTYPGTSAIRYTYDNQGNLDSTITALGYRSKRANDAMGRPQTVTTQLNTANTQFATETRTYTLWNQDSTALSSAGGESITVTTGHDAEGRVTLVKRTFAPDPKSIGAMSDTWSYDLGGRLRTKTTAAGGTETYTMDPAGNPKTVLNARNYTTTMGYDALNRLTTRSYLSAPGAPHTTTIVTAFPAGVPYSETIPGDTETFQYTADGVLRLARNCDAEVQRTIHSSGRIDDETAWIRTVTGLCNDWGAHQFTTSYGYDRNNRRVKTTIPGLFATATPGDSIKFGYDPATGGGRLTSVRDLMGNTITLAYKLSGELRQATYPGSVIRQMGYDVDGQLAADTITTLSGFPMFPATVMRRTAFGYDARGKLLTASDGTGFQEQVQASYSGLGYLDASWLHQSYISLTGYATGFSTGEAFGHDALGNQTTHTTADTVVNSSGSNATATSATGLVYAAGSGRLTSRPPRSYSYDAAGNLEWEVHTGIFERAHYYSADGRLRVADYREIGPALFAGARQRTREQYRYDALGRRVLVWTQIQCMIDIGFECTRDRIRRTIWDGTQELIEIQAPGDTANQTKWEIDVGGYTLNRINNGTVNFDPNPYFGQVVYAGALGIDQPLSVTRIGYADKPTTTYTVWAPFAFYPHWNDRGQAVFGSFGDGGAVKQFVTGAGGATCPGLTSTSTQRCALFDWAAGSSAYDRKKGTPAVLGWHGTLIDNKRDGSGLDFKRNRVTDPTTGRFTQEDLIGLAGGLNLYGFANGDPVNFSDPFGLCPPDDAITGPHCNRFVKGLFPNVSTAANRIGCTAAGIGKTAASWREVARSAIDLLGSVLDVLTGGGGSVDPKPPQPRREDAPPPAGEHAPPPPPGPPGDGGIVVTRNPDGGVVVSPAPAPAPSPPPATPPPGSTGAASRQAQGGCQGAFD